MKKYPPRPTATREIIMQAAAKVADAICDSSTAAQDIADAYERRGPDCFAIAKELDLNGRAALAVFEALDEMYWFISCAVRKLEKEWAEENDIQPTLEIGAVIKEGVITGIYERQPAYYMVKQHGCTDDGRHLLIKFEDAQEVAK